ncbi:regulator [Streptomyces sp. NPDC059928]|uniref:regulator n=1 Tax=unclassified Streptomyces TaxID=2593676 RepID=UPI00365B6D33
MTTSFTTAELLDAATLLSSAPLIRLISEIDDNGAIPQRRLAATLSDLTPHHLRRATEEALALGLVRAKPGAGLNLTTCGAELADLYDATARWARRHDYPTRTCDFITRVQRTLRLLAPTLVADGAEGPLRTEGADMPSAEAVAELVHPRLVLSQWLNANPQILTALPEPEPVA